MSDSKPVDLAVWQEFGIYPNAYKDRIDEGKLNAKAERVLTQLPQRDLEILSIGFKLRMGNDARPEDIARALLSSLPKQDIAALYELSKRRGQAIHWAARAQASIRKLLRGQPNIRPFTKLLLVYREGEGKLRNIFYYDCWFATNSAAKFVLPNSVKNPARILKQKLEPLSNLLSKYSEYGGGVCGAHALPNGTFVAVFLRKYRPRVTRDYKSATGFNLHHLCGSMVIGISAVDKLMHVRVESKEIVDAIEKFLREELKWEVTRRDRTVANVSDYTKFSSAIIEGHPISEELLLHSISYRRTKPTGIPLSIPEPAHCPNITPLVHEMHQQGFTDGLSLLDIAAFTLRYKGGLFPITVNLRPNAMVLLTYENKGIDEHLQQEFDHAVLKSLGLPLGCSIDPSGLPQGTVAIIASLLNTGSMDEVDVYRKPIVDELQSHELLSVNPAQMAKCSNRFCESQPQVAAGEEHCQKCNSPLRFYQKDVITPNESDFVALFAEAASSTGEWAAKTQEHSFEGLKFKTIARLAEGVEDDAVVVIPRRQLTKHALALLDRLGKPVIAIDSHLSTVPSIFDRIGSGVFSAPHLIAANLGYLPMTEIRANAAGLITKVLKTYVERVHRAATHSSERIASGTLKDGKEYEVDAFNLLRIIFPQTIRLGRVGEPEPDGLIPIPHEAGDGVLKALGSFVIGYDAKLNVDGKGYSLSRGEQRKVKDYIAKYRRSSTRLGGLARAIAAHAFVTNRLTALQMDKMCDYLYGPDGMPENAHNIRCLMIENSFLLAMHERIAQDYIEFQRRKQRFYDLLIGFIRSRETRYIAFRRTEAEHFLREMWRYDPIEDRMTVKEAENAFNDPSFAGLGLLDPEEAA